MRWDAAIYLGVLVALIAAVFVADSINPAQQPDIKIDLNTQVQEYANQHGILITKADSITNKFVEGARLGGAGGIVNMQIEYSNNSDFLAVLETNPNLDNIAYIEGTRSLSDETFTRIYYAYAFKNGATALITDTQSYPPPASNYDFKEATAGTAVYEHDVNAANDGIVITLILALLLWFLFGGGIIDAFRGPKSQAY